MYLPVKLFVVCSVGVLIMVMREINNIIGNKILKNSIALVLNKLLEKSNMCLNIWTPLF
tara:strand:- start:696 stop:872 length:177 start_codon:yes stop_codon:yes gene_type:complete